MDNNIESLESKLLIYPVATELYVPKIEDVVPVCFDGLHLAINGIKEYKYSSDDGAFVRILLEKTIANPDTKVASDLLITGKVVRAYTVKKAADFINSIFSKNDVKPLKVVLEKRVNHYIAPKVDHVIFKTGINHHKKQSGESLNNKKLEPNKTLQNKNHTWLKDLLSERSDLHHVQFEKMSQHELLLCRILHNRVGNETSVMHIKSIFENETYNKIDIEEFMSILTFWAQKYSSIMPLKRRISMRRIIDDGQPSASFIWHRPDYTM